MLAEKYDPDVMDELGFTTRNVTENLAADIGLLLDGFDPRCHSVSCPEEIRVQL